MNIDLINSKIMNCLIEDNNKKNRIINQQNRSIEEKTILIKNMKKIVSQLKTDLNRVLNSKSWRITSSCRWAYGKIRKIGKKS